MKTRIMTNPERTSYRLDVLEDGELTQHYFDNEQDAITRQNKLLAN